MLQNARVAGFAVSELFRENQQEGGGGGVVKIGGGNSVILGSNPTQSNFL